MVNNDVLRKAQYRMLDILLEVDKICEKHNIKYFIMYGTLLGAVRHKGFIPWDDDCDICMMRDDYERFKQVVAKELPDHYFLQDKNSDKYYDKKVVKIRDKNSKFVEFNESDYEKYNQGIYLDIFIFDYHIFGRQMYFMMNLGKYLKSIRKRFTKGSSFRLITDILILIPYGTHWLFKNILIFISRVYRKTKKINYIDMEMNLLNTYEYIGYDKNKIFPLKKTYEFEGHYFYGPHDSDYVLKKTYGDYMTLPKPEDRQWHAKKIEL